MNLNQVTVPSSDIPRSIAFYQSLGLKLIVESSHYARFLCPDGTATFSVHLVDQLPTGHGISVYFECENLDEKVEQLLQKGLVFDQLPKRSKLVMAGSLSERSGRQSADLILCRRKQDQSTVEDSGIAAKTFIVNELIHKIYPVNAGSLFFLPVAYRAIQSS